MKQLRDRPAGALRRQLLRSGGGSLILKGMQVCLMLALAVVLARTLGADGYGVYAYAFALVELLGLPGQMGIQTLVIREIARFREQEDWNRLRGALRFGVVGILAVSAVVMIAIGLIAWVRRSGMSTVQLATLLWALVLLPVVSLLRLFGAALRGLKEIIRGLLPENLIQPGGFLLLLIGGLVFLQATWVTPQRAMFLHVVAACAGLLVGAVMLVRHLPDDARTATVRLETGNWIAATVPLTLITGMQVINSHADLVMLGIFGGAGDVGVYRVVVDSSLLVLFGLRAINTAIAPHLSALWTSNEMQRLQMLVTIAARVALGFALPLALILLLFGRSILTVVFGAEYAVGYLALSITVVGQVVNAAFGSIALLLNMTGHEQTVVRGLGVAATANVLLNLVLIPRWGLEGAAVATVATLALWNGSLWWAARNMISVDSLAFRRLGRS